MLYVVVPVHNRAAVTARFLDALAHQTFDNYQLLMVDDGCSDNTVAIAHSKLPEARLKVLRGDGQLWWAGSLQLAYEHVASNADRQADDVIIINDDVTFDRDFLANGLAVLAEHAGACIQSLGIDAEGGTVDRGAVADLVHLKFRAAEVGETPNCLSTRGLLMSMDTFLRSGGFRPKWLPHYMSDYEFTLRMRRLGIPLLVDDRFTARVSLEMTGLSEPHSRSLRRIWKDSLSNRAKFNPKHWSAFALMVCPPWIAPVHVARIWFRFARKLLHAAINREGPAC